jgi:hypothetical protein
MSERVSPGAAGQQLGVSGGDIRRAGYTSVTAARLDAWEQEPPSWLRRAQARKRRSAQKAAGRPRVHRIDVTCCVCGTMRQVRPCLVVGFTHLVCGPCNRRGNRPDVPARDGMVLTVTANVAGYFIGYTHRIATLEERASVDRAAALARDAFPSPDLKV